LRGQLEQYIVEELGADSLSRSKNQTELRKIKKEMADLKKRLDELQARRTEIEKVIVIVDVPDGLRIQKKTNKKKTC
jgi:hypothetical protein